MEELSLHDIHNVELEILKHVASICDSQGLRYFLYYGTLIGAIRHHGFIPWDDDVDICMPRPDYEKLIDYFKTNREELKPLEIEHYSVNKKYIFPILRISNSDYYTEYEGKKDYGLGVFIDIYPFDGCGNSQEEVEKTYKKTKNLISIISSGGRSKFEKSPGGVLRNIFKWVLYNYTNIFGLYSVIKRLDTIAKRTPFENCEYVNTTVWWTSTKYVQKRSDITDYIDVDFEGESFKTIRNYDKFLSSRYGDYMQYPPEEERVGHHFYRVFKKD